MAIPLFITLNGAQVPLGDVDPDVTALAWIRSQGLTGAKEGCAEGECGACAVLVVKPSGPGPCTVDATSGAAAEAVDAAAASRWTAVNACLVPVGALAGQEVRTAEDSAPRPTCTPSSASWPPAVAPSAATAPPGSSAAWPRSSTVRGGAPQVRATTLGRPTPTPPPGPPTQPQNTLTQPHRTLWGAHRPHRSL